LDGHCLTTHQPTCPRVRLRPLIGSSVASRSTTLTAPAGWPRRPPALMTTATARHKPFDTGLLGGHSCIGG
jgi:hypothetical protein